jgi:hypothetical protein
MSMTVNGTSGLTFPDTTTLASAGQASVRAWVNFNGTGTVAIRAAYNVTSITDGGAGTYTVNFTIALPDANYATVMYNNANSTPNDATIGFSNAFTGGVGSVTTSSVQVTSYNGSAFADSASFNVAIFR